MKDPSLPWRRAARLAAALVVVAAFVLATGGSATTGPQAAQPAGTRAGAPPERSLESQVAAANAAFARARYDEAARLFRDAIARHGYSAPLLYDLGNAWLRAGRIGEAVLAYERALALAPRDADVRANLREARRAGHLRNEAPDGWTRLASVASADEWAWAASASLSLAAALAVLAALRRPAPLASRRLWLGAGAAALAAVLASLLCARQVKALDRAVVTAEDARLRDAPYEAAELGSSLPPGEMVRIEQRHGAYALVRTRSGRSGWVPLSTIERIAPRPDERPSPRPSGPGAPSGDGSAGREV